MIAVESYSDHNLFARREKITVGRLVLNESIDCSYRGFEMFC